jgi:hypothetical protein
MSVQVRAPEGAVVEPPRPLTLEEVPGATLAFHGEWLGPQVRLTVVCATRPVPIWVDGLAPVVLGGMTGMVRKHLRMGVVRGTEPRRETAHLVQTFSGEGQTAVVRGAHYVGWADADTLLACSAACESSHEPACTTSLSELDLQPGFVVRERGASELALNATLQHPREALSVAIVVLLAMAVAVLMRRPSESAL